MKTILQRWGNSQGIRIPKSLLDRLGVTVGSEVVLEITEDQSSITVKPAIDQRPIRGRHRIEDLIASSSPAAFQGEYDWGQAQGDEVW